MGGFWIWGQCYRLALRSDGRSWIVTGWIFRLSSVTAAKLLKPVYDVVHNFFPSQRTRVECGGLWNAIRGRQNLWYWWNAETGETTVDAPRELGGRTAPSCFFVQVFEEENNIVVSVVPLLLRLKEAETDLWFNALGLRMCSTGAKP